MLISNFLNSALYYTIFFDFKKEKKMVILNCFDLNILLFSNIYNIKEKF